MSTPAGQGTLAFVPELPEVEHAARALARATSGARIVRAIVLHPYVGRNLRKTSLRRLVGRAIARVERRGKHQLAVLDDGAMLHVHFRMTGNWVVSPRDEELPRFARFVLELENGSRIVLADPRALSTVEVLEPGASIATILGPDAVSEQFDAAHLRTALARRRIAIKPALLDQSVVAGIGNIYAAEALWLARIDPRVPASRLGARDVERLVRAIRRVLSRGRDGSGRYTTAGSARLNVYDREGKRCPRCGTSIARLVQAARSTYWCPGCQVNPALRAKRP
ncbi:MAG TPA: bifunctional DNA-formamidopyrimidine glycosylase/DNA-(apurinic or apyrimidinic site) lyase [Gemmatimonadaceae bacterium]|nr:bifunctional DNA-formamidopyrimidine glycosylase/DNA-(apurinic or apyrimidinic site) lyase [Gemmatimonadaceae bacterium]